MLNSKHLRKALIVAAILLAPAPCLAQYTGNNLRGDHGLESGTQPPPGWHVSLLYGRYATETARDHIGDGIRNFSGIDEATIQTVTGRFSWVSGKKFLGASYGLLLAPSLADNAMEAPALGLDDETGFGLGDLYIQPINLGWHLSRADFIAGAGIFLPTGLYEPGADDNTGLGMLAGEIFAGSTVFFDAARTWSFAATGFWEIHHLKENSPVRIGDVLTVEGGVGKSLFDGAASAGIAYYAQWKLSTDDQVEELGHLLSRHRVYAAGPEVTLPIECRGRLLVSLGFRGLLEFGADSTTEGATLVITATFPIEGGG